MTITRQGPGALLLFSPEELPPRPLTGETLLPLVRGRPSPGPAGLRRAAGKNFLALLVTGAAPPTPGGFPIDIAFLTGFFTISCGICQYFLRRRYNLCYIFVTLLSILFFLFGPENGIL